MGSVVEIIKYGKATETKAIKVKTTKIHKMYAIRRRERSTWKRQTFYIMPTMIKMTL